MYVPTHFSMPPEEVSAVLASVLAGDLVTAGADGLVATFLPLLYDAEGGPHGRLLGHVARNNRHWTYAGHGSSSGDGTGPGAVESLVILRGPDAYISPNWYQAKREHGRVVPTWNYTTLHVYGNLVAHDDVQWLRGIVTRLTERQEAGMPAPWAVTDAPEAYIAGQLRAIVGLELMITRVEAKAKLSQNRSEADQAGVIAGLTGLDPADPVAAAMTKASEPAVDGR
jgi:transcriptional regulator